MMKRGLWVVAFASLMFVSCYFNTNIVQPSRAVPCNVDPDEVFGAHYTAADFQIWPMADDEMARILSSKAVEGKGITSMLSGWRVSFAIIDTAEVGALARELCASHRTGDTVCCYGWIPDDFDSTMSVIVFVCGAKPLIDGTAVAGAYVETFLDKPELVLEFAKEHHSDWQRITKDNIGRCLPVMLGGHILMIPMVYSEITEGKCSVSSLSEEKCCALAAILSGGTGLE